MSTSLDDILVDDEFANANRLLTDEENAELLIQISRFGFRDPLVVWRHHNVLLDGHNRYRIWDTNYRDDDNVQPPEVVDYEFPDRAAALEWVKKNQRARRNLATEEMAYLRGKEYREKKKPVGAPKGKPSNNKKVNVPKSSTLTSTADELGQKHGVSAQTIRGDAAFSKAVDAISQNVSPEAAHDIIKGESGLTRQQVRDVASLPPDQQAAAYVAASHSPRTPELKVADVKAESSQRIADFSKRANDLVKDIITFSETKPGHFVNTVLVKRLLRDVRSELKRAELTQPCRECQGKACMLCGHVGYVPASQYEG